MATQIAPQQDYEVLDYEASIEIADAEGREATYVRRERIRFLRGGVSALDSYGWGNGIAFAAHEAFPGELAEHKLVGSRLRSTIHLPHRYHKGDEFTFSVERLVKNGFVSPSECWLEAKLYHQAQSVRLQVILPASRRVQSAGLIRPGFRTTKALRVTARPDGRQRISFQDRRPPTGQRYTIVWDW